MNIHWIQQASQRWQPDSRRATGLFAMCLAFGLSLACAVEAKGQGIATANHLAGAGTAASGKTGGMFQHGDQAYRVIRAEDYSPGNDGGDAMDGTIAQAGFFGGKRCSSACDSGCTSCGPMGSMGSIGSMGSYGGGGGCVSCGNHGTMGGMTGAMACPQCESYWYGSLEGLYMQRTGDRRFSVSPDFFITDFDYKWAPRLTLGMVPDCVHGYEVSFTGRFEFDRIGFLSDPSGNIGTFLFAVPPVDPADLSSFNNAITKAQSYKAEYWSLEASNTTVGWGVAKLLCGVRYIDYDENFTLISQTATEVGLLRSDVDNQLLGYQVGMDLLYPVCPRTYADLRARAGLYANFIDLDLEVVNNGSLTALLLDESTKLAANLEFGSGLRYQFSDNCSVRSGFELWYFTGMASATDQFTDGILARQKVRAKEDFVLIGLSIGAEFRF